MYEQASRINANRRKVGKLVLSIVVLTLALTVANLFTTRVWNVRSVYDRSSHDQSCGQISKVESTIKTPNSDTSFDQDETPLRRLHAIIIGVNRCGTGALLAYLNFYPDVVVADRDINYFSLNYDEGREWYRNQMPVSTRGQLTMEKTAMYYRMAEVPERIHALNASIKFILIVREPVNRSVSDWCQACSKDHRTDADVCRMYETSGVFTSKGDINQHSRFIICSSYAHFIENWTRLFPLGTQLHLVDGDKLVSDPVPELNNIETFLGLRHYITKKNVVFNKERGFYCMVSSEGKTSCTNKDKGRKHPSVDPKIVSKLKKYFKPLNQRFYRVVGHDFGWTS